MEVTGHPSIKATSASPSLGILRKNFITTIFNMNTKYLVYSQVD